MGSQSGQPATVIGKRMRAHREELGWSLEKLRVAIGIDESSSRARISRYELGTHEPPVKTAAQIAEALQVPLAYLYCEDEDVADLLLKLGQMPKANRTQLLKEWRLQIA